MRLDFTNERILAVVAHPDDAEYLCAGTLARAQADGAAIGICVMCRGDKGQPDPPIANLGAVRKKEMTAAAKLLGAELLWAGFGDGELADRAQERKELVELFRRFEPTLVLAHSAVDYHADHRAASSLAEAASWFATSGGHKTESSPLGVQPALWWMDTVNMTGFEPHFYIDISEHVALKRRMLGCHESQLVRGAGGDFSPLDEQMVRQSKTRGSQAGVEAAEAFRLHHAWKRLRAW